MELQRAWKISRDSSPFPPLVQKANFFEMFALVQKKKNYKILKVKMMISTQSREDNLVEENVCFRDRIVFCSHVIFQSLTGFCFFIVLGLCHRGIKSVIRRLRKMMKFTYNNTDGNNTNRSAFLRSFGFSCYDFKSFMKYWLTEKEIDEETNRPLYEFGVYCIDFLNDFNLSKIRGELSCD